MRLHETQYYAVVQGGFGVDVEYTIKEMDWTGRAWLEYYEDASNNLLGVSELFDSREDVVNWVNS